jgi:hypothetical protein
MPKIYSDLTLQDLLRAPVVNTHYDPEFDRRVEFERPQGGIISLMPVVISDINKGRFDSYKEGRLQIRLDPQRNLISINEIKGLENQEGLIQGSIICSWPENPYFRMIDARDEDYFKTDFLFAIWDQISYPKPGLSFKTGNISRQRVSDLLKPFIRPEELETIIEAIVNPKQPEEPKPKTNFLSLLKRILHNS